MVQVRFHAPTLTAAEAARLALELYGVSCEGPGRSIHSLPSERDQNFRLATGEHESYVLKISQPNESRPNLEMQERVLNHLQGRVRAADLVLPRVVPTTSGETLATTIGPDGAEHLVRMLTFVPGTVWADVQPHSSDLLRSLGRALALVDGALADFPPSGAFGDLKWDLSRAGWIREYFTHLPAGRRALVERLFEQYEHHAAPRLSLLPSGLLYNDANEHNVLVAGERVVSLIDFGDMVHGPRVCDLAIGIAYGVMGAPNPLASAADIVAGYHGASSLTDAELEVLYPLICARLCVSVTNSAYQRTVQPDNAYLQVSDAGAWSLLELLNEVHPRQAVDAFRSACRLSSRPSDASIAAARARHLSPNLSLAYRRPLHIVRGFGQYLYDADGRQYLDAVNNVAHVGHCHPRVVSAGQEQMAVLNTNSRYLHSNITRYAERLCETLPDPLRVCFFVNSGSEAGDLALRLARTHTGSRGTVVIDGAYHGNTGELVAISPYKYDGRGGAGQPANVRKVPTPDVYRGWSGSTGVPEAIAALNREGYSRPTFIAESLLGSCGQFVLPPGFLADAYEHTRAANGVCIADEVQVGFGRVGTHFWGFQTQGVLPDIVVMGKPMGNGHPLGAVVTTPEIAASFNNGMEYFSTFGGNPVSCAIGLAVLDVIQEEALQPLAQHVGERLRQGFRGLATRHALIGDVRGLGLFIGVELVRDRDTLAPAPDQTAHVCNRLKDLGILVSVDGPRHNVLKIKPPLVFTAADAERFVATLDSVLAEDDAQA